MKAGDPAGARRRGRKAGVTGPGGPAASVAIRPAKSDDVPLILQFIRELAVFEKLIGDVEATEGGLRQALFPPGGGPPAAHVLIAEVGGVPAGYAVYFFTYSTFPATPGLYVEDLFVRPRFRRKGIGKALLAGLARLARARGCGHMEWAVLDWNERAIEFYRRIGAVPRAEWTTYRLTGAALREYPDKC
jgi:GNAT superfamily N-acetyltransferase